MVTHLYERLNAAASNCDVRMLSYIYHMQTDAPQYGYVDATSNILTD